MTRVKICGITRPEDALAAAAAGADAIGLVFAESPRRVTPRQAAEILAALPPFVTPVALFVNQRPEHIRSVCEPLGIRTVQLHGDEGPEVVDQLHKFCVIKAFRIGSRADLAPVAAYASAAILLDARVRGRRGGTGQAFEWSLLDGFEPPGPLILAGGLGPQNVAEAIRRVRPFADDASSGVERVPGEKDPARVRAFVAAARRAFDDLPSPPA